MRHMRHILLKKKYLFQAYKRVAVVFVFASLCTKTHAPSPPSRLLAPPRGGTACHEKGFCFWDNTKVKKSEDLLTNLIIFYI